MIEIGPNLKTVIETCVTCLMLVVGAWGTVKLFSKIC